MRGIIFGWMYERGDYINCDTVVLARVDFIPAVCNPGQDVNEIRHERWNTAFQNDRIASYSVFGSNVGFINLCNN